MLASLFLATALLVAGEDPARFDCTKAVGPDDILICQDAELTRLDEHLGRVYRALLRLLTADAFEDLRQDQRAWVFRRNAGCGVSATTVLTGANVVPLIGCFRTAYVERLLLLEMVFDLAKPGGQLPDSTVLLPSL